MTHNACDIKNYCFDPIWCFLKKYKIIFCENSDINFEQNNINSPFKIQISIQRIIETNTINIKEFLISDKNTQRKNAFILLSLLDGRISLSNRFQIIIYNEI